MSDPEAIAARLAGRVAVLFGGVMHAAVGAFVVASAGVLPLPAVAGLVTLWSALAVLGWRWRHSRPPVVLLLPFVAALAWWLVAGAAG